MTTSVSLAVCECGHSHETAVQEGVLSVFHRCRVRGCACNLFHPATPSAGTPTREADIVEGMWRCEHGHYNLASPDVCAYCDVPREPQMHDLCGNCEQPYERHGCRDEDGATCPDRSGQGFEFSTPSAGTPDGEGAEPDVIVNRIVDGLEAAGHRFHHLGEQAEADRRFIGERYEAHKDAGCDFMTASRRAKREFVTAALSTLREERERLEAEREEAE